MLNLAEYRKKPQCLVDFRRWAALIAPGIVRGARCCRTLRPQYQDFRFQPPPRLEAVAQHADEKEGNCNHATIML
jgi:type IV secretion system protein TrbE